MTQEPRDRPILLCAGTDASVAARLAEVVVPLLAGRPAVVLAKWDPPALTGGFDAVMDALYDTHADLRAAAHDAAARAADAAREVLEPHAPAITRRVVEDARGAWQVILDVAAQLLRPRPAVVATAWMTAAQVVGAAMLALPDEVARKGAGALDAASR